MSENPNRQITIFFIAVLLIFLFFTLFAFFFLGGSSTRYVLPGTAMLTDDEDSFDNTVDTSTAGKPTYSQLKSPMPLSSSFNRGKYIPQTNAERAYFSASKKIAALKKRGAARRKRHKTIRDFFESPLGQNLKSTFELARRGQSEAAKKFLDRILAELVEMDPMIQEYVLQSAISIYAHDKDKKGLSRILKKYLKFADEQNIGDEDQRLELIAQVRRKAGELGE